MNMETVIAELTGLVPKENILVNEPMKKHTTFRIGGEAACFVQIENEDQLAAVWKCLQKKQVPVLILGNGSNLRCFHIQQANVVFFGQTHGSDPHYTAAALAVIADLGDIVMDGLLHTHQLLQRAQAGKTGGAANKQVRVGSQRTDMSGQLLHLLEIRALGQIPFFIGLGNRGSGLGKRIFGIFMAQTLGGEQSHLGIVGDPRQSIYQLILGNPLRAEGGGDFRHGRKFHGVAKGIACCTTQ